MTNLHQMTLASIFVHTAKAHPELLPLLNHGGLAKEPNDKSSALVILDEVLSVSKSQLLQDLFVLSRTNFKRDGFFVEFGACDGEIYSNTWLLEKLFSWRGVVAEPARGYSEVLTRNRGCAVDLRCVWASSNENLVFRETSVGELSTIEDFKNSDHHFEARELAETYEVESISLNDLLLEHHAPPVIDYISVDTEGSEYEILRNFDFERWDVRIFTIEHNFGPNRGLLSELMRSRGYVQQLSHLSQFDDWWVRHV